MNSSSSAALAGSRTVARNVTYSLMGQGIPILVALASMPLLIQNLGAERFGVLALAWVIAGYFNIFDLGVGRAVVRLVVQRKSMTGSSKLFEAVWSAFLMATLLGVISAVVLYATSTWMALHFFSVHGDIEYEVEGSLRVLALAIPFTVTSSIFRGTLEGFQRFDWINYIQAPVGSLTYLLPFAISIYTTNLPLVIGSIAFLRVVLWIMFVISNAFLLRDYPRHFKVGLNTVKELLRFGFWITTSNIINPFMSYLDRFMIGSLVSVTAVAFYTAPMEIALKLPIIPGAVFTVVYPLFAAYADSSEKLLSLFGRTFRFVAFIMMPLCFVFSVFAPEVLTVWISHDYAMTSAPLLRIAAIGILANSLALVPLAYLQAVNRPSIPAKFHVVEFPIYIGVLYGMISAWGLIGAVVAWSLRMIADCMLLYFAALRDFRSVRKLARLGAFLLVAMSIMYAAGEMSLGWRLGLLAVSLPLYPVMAWFLLFSDDDQEVVLQFIMRWLVDAPDVTLSSRNSTVETVAVAMAIYKPDPEQFLRQIRSLKAQTFSRWQCYITSDSPVEDTLAHAEIRAELSDPRFRIFQNERQLGSTKNFEMSVRRIFEHGNPDAVAFCDQDDFWYPQKLEILIQQLQKSPVNSLVHCDSRVVDTRSGSAEVVSSSLWNFEKRRVDDKDPFRLLIRNVVTGAATLIDAGLLKRYIFVSPFFKFHDHWYAYVASCHGGVYPVREPLYDYIQHGNNVIGAIEYRGLFSGKRYQGLVRALGKLMRIRRPHVEWEQVPDGMPKELMIQFVAAGRIRASVTLILVGFLSLRRDSSLSRACLIKGLSRLVERRID